MPWNDNSNGGGPWGGGQSGGSGGQGGGRGPWGERQRGGGPGGGRGPGQQPPDLEDFIRRMQSRFGGVFGGGSGGRGSGIGGFFFLLIIAIIVWLLWPGSGWYVVQPNQQGVVLRFGQFDRVDPPGFHLKLPFPIETRLTPDVESTQSNRIPGATGAGAGGDSFMLTGDQNIVELEFDVQWEVGDRFGTTFGVLAAQLNDRTRRTYGSFVDDAPDPDAPPVRGVIAAYVEPGSPAAAVIPRGSIITRIGDQQVIAPLDAREASEAAAPDGTGDVAVIFIAPDGSEQSVSVAAITAAPPSDIENHLFRIDDPVATLESVAESVMREVVGQETYNRVLASDVAISALAAARIQETLDQYLAGIEVENVVFRVSKLPDVPVSVNQLDDDGQPVQDSRGGFLQENVSPEEARQLVVEARTRAETFRLEARAYRERVVPVAEGNKARVLNEAQAEANALVAEARGEAARFLNVLEEYQAQPEIIRYLRHRETMERVLARAQLMVIDPDATGGAGTGDGAGVVPVLPLTQFNRPSGGQ